jgi:hypothetical protein
VTTTGCNGAFASRPNIPHIPQFLRGSAHRLWPTRKRKSNTRSTNRLLWKGHGTCRILTGHVYSLTNRHRHHRVIIAARDSGTYHPNYGAPSSIAPLPPALPRSPSVSSKSFSAQAASTQAVDITRKVPLKSIPKKKVKGNEDSVWSEMWVVQGLNHPNIIRPISPRAIYLPSS